MKAFVAELQNLLFTLALLFYMFIDLHSDKAKAIRFKPDPQTFER